MHKFVIITRLFRRPPTDLAVNISQYHPRDKWNPFKCLKPIERRRSHALSAPLKLKNLSYNLTPRPLDKLTNHCVAFPRSSIRASLFTVPATDYEWLFVNNCEGRHTTENFSHGANYKKNIRRREPIPGIAPQGRHEACQSIFF